MTDNAFEPSTVDVAAGTPVEIELRNNGQANHNFTSDALHVSTGPMRPGSIETMTVTVPKGTTRFVCTWHPGMVIDVDGARPGRLRPQPWTRLPLQPGRTASGRSRITGWMRPGRRSSARPATIGANSWSSSGTRQTWTLRLLGRRTSRTPGRWSTWPIIGLPGLRLRPVRGVETHAREGAPWPRGGQYPIVLFSHGRCGFRQHNTVQVEELVSRGYVVATIDHPYAASGVVFPDGRLVPLRPAAPPAVAAGRPARRRPGFAEGVLPYLVRDARSRWTS